MRANLQDGTVEAGEAAKHAGRMSFAVTVAADRCGRAYVLSMWTRLSLQWWIAFLEDDELKWRSTVAIQRTRVFAWTDAAGESRMLSAMIHVAGQWHFTYLRMPATVWQLLLPRRGHQIALQELIAVVMLVATFGEELMGCELSLYIDSDAVLGALLKGGCRAEDANLIIGPVWLWLAQEQIAIEIWRVESKANVADDPRRDQFQWLRKAGAIPRRPKTAGMAFPIMAAALRGMEADTHRPEWLPSFRVGEDHTFPQRVCGCLW